MNKNMNKNILSAALISLLALTAASCGGPAGANSTFVPPPAPTYQKTAPPSPNSRSAAPNPPGVQSSVPTPSGNQSLTSALISITPLDGWDTLDPGFYAKPDGASISLAVVYPPSYLTLDDYVSMVQAQIKTGRGDAVRFESASHLTVAGLDARDFVYTAVNKPGDYKYRDVYIQNGASVYIIECWAPAAVYDKTADEFQRMINSFALKN